MQKELNQNQFIIPTADLCHLWQRNRSVEFQWYFSMLKSFGAQRVLVDRLAQKGQFAQELKRELDSNQLQAEYFVTVQEWTQWENKIDSLTEGVHFIFLIYKPLTPDFFYEIVSLRKFLPQMKFIVIARKDWNFQNTFRSIPYFMRANLYVDFPLSTYPSDPFYEVHEIKSILAQMSKDFRDKVMTSFCPNLRFLSIGLQTNIASISTPRKLTKNTPKISLITQDPNQIEKIKDLPAIRNYGHKFEVLITRVAGIKTQVIPKIQNVLTTRYWVHPINNFANVSRSYLNNFSASQADGELLFFIDELSTEEISAALNLLHAESYNFEVKRTGKILPIFKRERFYKLGGLDPAFTNPSMAWSDFMYRNERVNKAEFVPHQKLQELDLEKKINFELLTHKFVDSLDDFSSQIENNKKLSIQQIQKEKSESIKLYRRQWAKEIYLTLYRSSPKVAIEGNLSYLYEHLGLWRLNPKVYKLYWQFPYLLFRLSFPIRKIYYFLNYQFEKRVLGLHKPQKMIRKI